MSSGYERYINKVIIIIIIIIIIIAIIIIIMIMIIIIIIVIIYYYYYYYYYHHHHHSLWCTLFCLSLCQLTFSCFKGRTCLDSLWFFPGGVRTTIAKNYGQYSESDHLCQDGVEWTSRLQSEYSVIMAQSVPSVLTPGHLSGICHLVGTGVGEFVTKPLPGEGASVKSSRSG